MTGWIIFGLVLAGLIVASAIDGARKERDKHTNHQTQIAANLGRTALVTLDGVPTQWNITPQKTTNREQSFILTSNHGVSTVISFKPSHSGGKLFINGKFSSNGSETSNKDTFLVELEAATSTVSCKITVHAGDHMHTVSVYVADQLIGQVVGVG